MRGIKRTSGVRAALAVVVAVSALVLSACAEARVDYVFEEDGSFRVSGQVVVTEVGQHTDQRLARMRDRMEQAGLTVDRLPEPGRTGLVFSGHSSSGDWARLAFRGTPRLGVDQGMLTRTAEFTWALDWTSLVHELFPELIYEDEAAALETAAVDVTVTFPGEITAHNGDVVVDSGGRTVLWTVTPLQPATLRAERAVRVWWRAVLLLVMVGAGAALLVVGRFRAVRRVAEPATRPLVFDRPAASGAAPRFGSPDSTPSDSTPSDSGPSASVAPACPVCDATLDAEGLCPRCIATVESAREE